MNEGKPAPEQDPKTGRFVSGNIGGPGKPHGSRNKLGEAFLQALQEDFSVHGPQTIERVRDEKPDQYLKVIASLLPKDVNLTVNNEIEMTDDELRDRIRSLADSIAPFLGGNGTVGEGIETPRGRQVASRVH